MSGPITYEVNLTVGADLSEEYQQWLNEHVQQMLALPGFTGATCYRIIEPAEQGKASWSVHYVLENQAALDAYLQTHAARMRADGIARFGDRFTATRRIYQEQ